MSTKPQKKTTQTTARKDKKPKEKPTSKHGQVVEKPKHQGLEATKDDDDTPQNNRKASSNPFDNLPDDE